MSLLRFAFNRCVAAPKWIWERERGGGNRVDRSLSSVCFPSQQHSNLSSSFSFSFFLWTDQLMRKKAEEEKKRKKKLERNKSEFLLIRSEGIVELRHQQQQRRQQQRQHQKEREIIQLNVVSLHRAGTGPGLVFEARLWTALAWTSTSLFESHTKLKAYSFKPTQRAQTFMYLHLIAWARAQTKKARGPQKIKARSSSINIARQTKPFFQPLNAKPLSPHSFHFFVIIDLSSLFWFHLLISFLAFVRRYRTLFF